MALDPLATDTDIRERLGRELTTAETARVGALLSDVSARVRNYTGREFTQRTSTVRLRVHNGRLVLPQRPVVSITSITAINRDGTAGPVIAGWYWDGLYTVTLPLPGQIANGPEWPDYSAWGAFNRSVDIVYVHGDPVVPDIVVAVVCSIVMRAFGRKPEEGGMTSESIDGYSYSVGAIGAAGALGMFPDEQAALDVFRLQAGTTWTSR